MDSFEDENSYEEDEEEETGSGDEEDFDIRDFVVADEGRGNEDEEEEEEEEEEDTASSRKTEEEDPEKLEEKLKTLEDVFSCVPRVLIKRVLCRDDVNGDLNLASQRLQEFQTNKEAVCLEEGQEEDLDPEEGSSRHMKIFKNI
ncbi:uncharacterized protein [Porites lutea]|uniref:uncharacterized protein n=1 Tax=Porites lutea TaxID=51062 RepID=UPI003CC6240B